MMSMLKIQSFDPDLGWINKTRAGDMPFAWGILAGYRRRWPSERHRLVNVSDTGEITVIPDDADALAMRDLAGDDVEGIEE